MDHYFFSDWDKKILATNNNVKEIDKFLENSKFLQEYKFLNI